MQLRRQSTSSSSSTMQLRRQSTSKAQVGGEWAVQENKSLDSSPWCLDSGGGGTVVHPSCSTSSSMSTLTYQGNYCSNESFRSSKAGSGGRNNKETNYVGGTQNETFSSFLPDRCRTSTFNFDDFHAEYGRTKEEELSNPEELSKKKTWGKRGFKKIAKLLTALSQEVSKTTTTTSQQKEQEMLQEKASQQQFHAATRRTDYALGDVRLEEEKTVSQHHPSRNHNANKLSSLPSISSRKGRVLVRNTTRSTSSITVTDNKKMTQETDSPEDTPNTAVRSMQATVLSAVQQKQRRTGLQREQLNNDSNHDCKIASVFATTGDSLCESPTRRTSNSRTIEGHLTPLQAHLRQQSHSGSSSQPRVPSSVQSVPLPFPSSLSMMDHRSSHTAKSTDGSVATTTTTTSSRSKRRPRQSARPHRTRPNARTNAEPMA